MEAHAQNWVIFMMVWIGGTSTMLLFVFTIEAAINRLPTLEQMRRAVQRRKCRRCPGRNSQQGGDNWFCNFQCLHPDPTLAKAQARNYQP